MNRRRHSMAMRTRSNSQTASPGSSSSSSFMNMDTPGRRASLSTNSTASPLPARTLYLRRSPGIYHPTALSLQASERRGSTPISIEELSPAEQVRHRQAMLQERCCGRETRTSEWQQWNVRVRNRWRNLWAKRHGTAAPKRLRVYVVRKE